MSGQSHSSVVRKSPRAMIALIAQLVDEDQADETGSHRAGRRRRGSVAAAVEILVREQPDITVEQLVAATGASERHVRRILASLQPAAA